MLVIAATGIAVHFAPLKQESFPRKELPNATVTLMLDALLIHWRKSATAEKNA